MIFTQTVVFNQTRMTQAVAKTRHQKHFKTIPQPTAGVLPGLRLQWFVYVVYACVQISRKLREIWGAIYYREPGKP